MSLPDRFWAKVEKTDTCWLWTAALDDNGYGRFSVARSMRYAHRVAYEALVEPVPPGLELDHLCRVRACCNPVHLEPVTHVVNLNRSPLGHAVKTHCPRGHEYDEGNTRHAHGRRYCRPCIAAWNRLVRQLSSEERAARKAAGLPLVDLDTYFAAQTAGAA